MMWSTIQLVLGFILLIKGAGLLVDGASSLGRRFNVSDLVIGLTIVAFGTSAPELFVNIMASAKGLTEIAIGNILGSNIANIFLILGISSIIYPLSVTRGTVWKEIPLSLLAAVLLGVLANDHLIDKSDYSVLSRIDGIVLLSFFIIFIYYSFGIAKAIHGIEEHVPARQHALLKSVGLIVLGFIGLIIGGNWIVKSATHMALTLGISESLISLTMVAMGTSLPELATSAVAAKKKNVEIAVGNIVGSNIFNIFFILGISSLIRPLPFAVKSNMDMGVGILAGFLLFICMFSGKKRSLDRWEGIVFIMLYMSYITFLLVRK